MGLFFLTLGGGVLLYLVYLHALAHWGQTGALLLIALLAILTGGTLLWLTKRLAR